MAGSVTAAAAACGVPERTLYRWLNEPAFHAELTAAEGAAIDEATRKLIGAAVTAVETLHAIVADPEASNNVRARAAGLLLDNLLKLRELRNVEQRLEALERGLHGIT